MSRILMTIKCPENRQKIIDIIRECPLGTRVEIKERVRTLSQNDRLWGMLSDVADQLTWHGHTLSAASWKLVFMDALNRESKLVPNIDGDGFVDIGMSTSDLSKEEMSNLFEVIFSFGAKHGVKFYDDYAKLGARE